MTYEEFIEQCKQKEPQLHEKHHIIPLCVGGIDDESNLINLSFEDHWTAHKLLAEENPDNKKIVNTFAGMGSQDSYVKKAAYKQSDAFRLAVRERMKDENIHEKLSKSSTGRKHTEETKQKISESMKKKHAEGLFTEHSRQLLSDHGKGRKHTEETKKKMSESRKKYWEQKKMLTIA